MLVESKYLLENFKIRKRKKQKETFRRWITDTFEQWGYSARVEKEKGLGVSCNVIVGDPKKANVVFTAHYDTCAALPFPNFMTPENMLIYTLYQLALVVGILIIVAAVEIFAIKVFDAGIVASMILVYITIIFIMWWILAGKANKSNVNDNTSGVITLLEIAAALDSGSRNSVAFVFFDNEEKGLLGSTAFFKRYKKDFDNRPLINFDCVSDGDDIRLYPNKAAKKDSGLIEKLKEAYEQQGDKRVKVVTGFGFYPSDQKLFTKGVGVAALQKKKGIGYYVSHIHTKRDAIMDEKNIAILAETSCAFAKLMQQERE